MAAKNANTTCKMKRAISIVVYNNILDMYNNALGISNIKGVSGLNRLPSHKACNPTQPLQARLSNFNVGLG